MELGIDCGGTKCEGIAFDNGKVVDHVYVHEPSTKKVLFSVIAKLLKKNSDVDFIGIGFPAPVNEGRVVEINNIKGWEGINIEHEIIKKFKIRCKVENDAKCFALAESRQKDNQEHDIVVGITLGTGLGCGIVIDNNIHRGATGAAGEINKMPYVGSNIENYTSKKFFSKLRKDPKEIFNKADLSYKKEKQIVRDFAVHLGKMLAVIVLAVDPDAVVFGGNISNAYKLFAKDMKKELKKHIYKSQYQKLTIKRSTLDYAGCIGAAMLKED